MTTTSAPGASQSSIRLTSRGLSMLTGGLILVSTGTLFALPAIAFAGSILVLATAIGWLTLRLSSLERGLLPLVLTRNAAPVPGTVGVPMTVSALITPRHATGINAAKLHSLTLSAQTPTGLNSPGALRGAITSEYTSIHLTYRLTPARRGTWPLGPLLATRTDILGVARSRTPFTDSTEVRVWPALVRALSDTRHGTTGVVTVRSGAGEPSDEDSSLRSYTPGDDLRRVHWASAAKHNQLMVRTNEGASLPHAAVVLDLVPLPVKAATLANDPATPAGQLTEWAVTVAASLAVHLLQGGHATRFISSDRSLSQPGFESPNSASVATWIRPQDEAGRALLLDQTLSLAVPERSAESSANRRDVLSQLTVGSQSQETVVCVLAPPSASQLVEHSEDSIESLLAPLRALGDGRGKRIALIVTPESHCDANPVVQRCQDELLASGWRTALVPPTSDLTAVWGQASGATR